MAEMIRCVVLRVFYVFFFIALLVAPLVAQESTEGPKRPSAEAAIPFKKHAEPSKDSIPRVVLVSLFAVGSILGAGVVLRRGLQRKGIVFAANGTRIKVSESKRIAQKMTVFLLEVDGKDYLLVQSGEQIHLARHDLKSSVEISNG